MTLTPINESRTRTIGRAAKRPGATAQGGGGESKFFEMSLKFSEMCTLRNFRKRKQITMIASVANGVPCGLS
jgi:hypothetical protein